MIGFESGTVVLWDLKSKKADYRYTYDEVTAVLSRTDLDIAIAPNSFSRNWIFSLGLVLANLRN